MEIVNNIWYAGPCDDQRGYKNFYEYEQAGKYVHGDDCTKLELVFIEEVDGNADHMDGTFFGVYNIKDKKIGFVWSSMIQTKMCSPDFFTHAIESGESIFIRVKIKD